MGARTTRAPLVAASNGARARGAVAAHVDFARVAGGYWAAVYPLARRELRAWRARAEAIPSEAFRVAARSALDDKERDAEGAAAFALFSPPAARAEVIRLLVAFQSMYAYLDTLTERAAPDPVANGRALHAALFAALDPRVGDADYFAHHPDGDDDGGYLRLHIAACREALAALPAYAEFAASLRRVAEVAAEGQTLNHAGLLGTSEAAGWLDGLPGAGLRPCELAAAASSPLAFYPLLAAAADPHATRAHALAIESAYFPWVCGLAAMLDSVVDHGEDARAGTHSAVEQYGARDDVGERVALLAARSLALVSALPAGRRHAVVLACIVSYYACTPEAAQPGARGAPAAALAAIGALGRPTLLMFRARQLVSSRR